MIRRLTLAAAALAGIIAFASSASAQRGAANPDRWEPAMKAFEAEAAKNPAAPGQIVFYGSSTIRMWDLAASFPDLKTVNRGFGGALMSDLPRYVSRVVTPLKPRIIVISCGGNDIEADATPEQVAGSFERLVETARKDLPDVRFVIFGVKVYPAIAAKIDQVRKTNALIRAFADHNKNIVVIDTEKIVLGKDGKPREELFRADGVHLTPEGYTLYTAALRPHLN